MKEISNQTLAVLLVVAIVASAGQAVLLMPNKHLEATGAATGLAKVNIASIVAISLPTSTVDFGTLFQGSTKNTTTNSPGPLTVQNDGGVNVNVSLVRDALSSALFSGTGGGDSTASFQFKVSDRIEVGSIDAASQTSWTNVPGTSAISNVIAGLKYNDANDIAAVDLLVNVPSDEPIGAKNETLVFTAIQAA
jgi:hypothetical protein